MKSAILRTTIRHSSYTRKVKKTSLDLQADASVVYHITVKDTKLKAYRERGITSNDRVHAADEKRVRA